MLSSEAIQAVHAMKLAKSSSKLEEVFQSRICRLLKADLLDTLTELRRQNELDLALKVSFFFVHLGFFICFSFCPFFFFLKIASGDYMCRNCFLVSSGEVLWLMVQNLVVFEFF